MTDIRENIVDETVTAQIESNEVDLDNRALGQSPLTDEPMTDEQFFSIRPKVVYKISDFEGPLDLLLELLKDAKINIEDIFISEVTHQYVEIIKNTPREELDYEYAGEFITLAAEMVYLKSIRTMPRFDDEDVLDDPELERDAFIRKVKEYALMREQAEKLKKMETINRFEREPVYTDKDYRVSLTNFSLPKLVEAFARVLANSERAVREAIPKKVVKDRFSVHDQMLHIRELLLNFGTYEFTALFEDDFDKGDIVITFLAVLELMKYGRIRAEQEEPFAPIMLYNVDGSEVPIPEDTDGEY